MKDFTFQDSLEMSEFERKMPDLAKDILDRFRTASDEQKLNALRQALWVGFCHGKGYNEEDN